MINNSNDISKKLLPHCTWSKKPSREERYDVTLKFIYFEKAATI
jgi:hypothetical protein